MKPVDSAGALDALQTVQSMTAAQVGAGVDGEIGGDLLGVLHALARASAPDADDEDVARRVHLMVLAWLLRGHVERAQP
jgi:hypothetical protein